MKHQKSKKFEIVKKGLAYKVLVFLYNNKGKKVYGSLIMRNTLISEPNISPVLKTLENLKLIKRDDKNKRTKYLSLTKNGEKLTQLLLQIDALLNKQKKKTR